GGPGFLESGGQLLLASVNTFTTPDAPAYGSRLGGMNVSAYAGWIESVVSDDSTAPAAPAGLTATAGTGSVSLQWAAGTEPDLAGYDVYRSTTGGGGYVRLESSPLATAAFTDTGVVNGVTYFYVVKAVDKSGNESGPSNEASAVPRGLSGTPAAGLFLAAP